MPSQLLHRALSALPSPRAAGAVIAAALVAFTCLVSLAPAASANTRSNWSKVVNGIAIGWTKNHAWAIASYATIIRLGGSKSARIACTAIIPEVPGIGYACGKLAGKKIASLIKGKPRVTNHGVWLAIYPSVWGRITMKGGRY